MSESQKALQPSAPHEAMIRFEDLKKVRLKAFDQS